METDFGAAGFPHQQGSLFSRALRWVVGLLIGLIVTAARTFTAIIRLLSASNANGGGGSEQHRQAVAFCLIMFCFFLCQALYGYFTGSLAVIALAFYTCFNMCSLFLGILAFIVSKQRPTTSYSYGQQRLEVLVAFIDGVCHCFSAIFIFFEAAEHVFIEYEAPENLNIVEVSVLAVVGMVLNLMCNLTFHAKRRMQALECRMQGEDFESKFWTILSTLAATIAVVLCSFMVEWGVHLADTLVAIFISILILGMAFPLARSTGLVLLQTTPPAIKDRLGKSLSEASMYEGVLECRNEHFWTLSPNEYVGSFCVHVKHDTDEQLVLAKVTNLFSSFIKHLTVQIEKEDLYFQ